MSGKRLSLLRALPRDPSRLPCLALPWVGQTCSVWLYLVEDAFCPCVSPTNPTEIAPPDYGMSLISDCVQQGWDYVSQHFGDSDFQEGSGPAGGKADCTAAGMVVKKIKPSPQLSVFYQCKCWSPFFKPSRDPNKRDMSLEPLLGKKKKWYGWECSWPKARNFKSWEKVAERSREGRLGDDGPQREYFRHCKLLNKYSHPCPWLIKSFQPFEVC